MNTTEKGDKLEDYLYNYLLSIADVYGKYVDVHKKKKYAYREGGFAIIDVSIDVYHSLDDKIADKPAMSYLYECKNTNRKLDKQDYHEVIGRCSMLGASGYKAIIVDTKGFSKDVINSATKNHVGLMKLSMSSDNVDVIVPRIVNAQYSSKNSCYEVMHQDAVGRECSILFDGKLFDIIAFFKDFSIPIKNERLIRNVYISDEDIEKTADEVYQANKTSHISDIISDILVNKQIKLVMDDFENEDLLGYFDMYNLEIGISEKLVGEEPRLRFTIAHELGHYFLHYKIFKERILSFNDGNETIDYLTKESEKFLEYQANKFASYLLLPRKNLLSDVNNLFNVYGIRKRLWVDKQSCNISNYNTIVGHIAYKYKVSKKTVAYRLMNMHLLETSKDFNI